MQNYYSMIDPILPCPNKWDGRNAHQIKAVVIHKPEGELPDVVNYLMAPVTQKSYHFIVGYNGQVTELVDPENSAWHCGVVAAPTWKGLIDGVDPNYYTIGISLEGFAVQPHTEAQFKSLCKLVADCLLYAGLPANEETIVFHHEIDGNKPCPGLLLNKQAVIDCAGYLVAAGNYVGWPATTAS
jgi:N-acetyl-anhydromuramyl-L-alanine amidase AmpD